MNRATSEAIIESMADLPPAEMPSEAMRWVAESVGTAQAVRLLLELGGVTIYLSKSARRDLFKRYVRKTFDGKNYRALALRLGLAERTIRDWTADLNKGTENED